MLLVMGVVGDGRGQPGIHGQRVRHGGNGSLGRRNGGQREVLVEFEACALDLLLAAPLGSAVLEPDLQRHKTTGHVSQTRG